MTVTLSALRHRLQRRRSFAVLWLLISMWAVVPLSLPAKLVTAQAAAGAQAPAAKAPVAKAIVTKKAIKHGHDEAAADCGDDGESCCKAGGVCSCAAACSAVFMLSSMRSWTVLSPAVHYLAAATVTVPACNHGPPLRPPTV